ncbi:MAG TPA: hypothetical protein VH599_19015 [Ktedonobacterales bacterium]|jgi:hypothetical protein
MFQQYMEKTCHICEQVAAGRCPQCRHRYCIEHFPLDQHQPCSQVQERNTERHVCYVCGALVRPTQWSANLVAHYFDTGLCLGCKRYVCDEHHTRRKQERMVIERDGMSSHRYHYILRYCDLCSPLRQMQGLLGMAQWLMAGLAVTLGLFFWFHH